MRQLRSILIDSLYESIDQKALLILLALSLILIAFCFGISFQTESPESILTHQSTMVGNFVRGGGPGGAWNNLFPIAEIKSSEIAHVKSSEGFDASLAGGYAVTLAFKNVEELDQLVQRWHVFKDAPDARGGRFFGREPLNSPQGKETASPEERLQFFNERFERLGYTHTQAKLLSAEPPTYRVAVLTEYPLELTGASRLRLLYGAIDVPLFQSSVAETVVQIQLLMANTFAGFIGVLVAVLVCSGFVPNMLQKGALDLVLARPIGRVRLLFYKYLGGLWFVAITSSFVIGGCWLAITVRTGYANPWFLASILTITATFAVIYSVSVLIGVITRSGTVAALLAIFIWGTSSTLIAIRNSMKLLYIGKMAPDWLRVTLDLLYDIAPKTADLNTLNTLFLSRSHLSEAAYQRTFATKMPPIDWAWSLGTTVAFTLVMLGLAAWFFRRRDY